MVPRNLSIPTTGQAIVAQPTKQTAVMVELVIALVVEELATLALVVAQVNVGPAIDILEKTTPTIEMSPPQRRLQ